MFRKNKRTQQPLLLTDLAYLPERSRRLLERSWAHTFRQEIFQRIDEGVFAVLYDHQPSRPNDPVNVLVGLEILKHWRGWSDEELYEHFLFDFQVRHAVGCDRLDENNFDLRVLYYFRARVGAHARETGQNLFLRVFEQVTDAQIQRLGLQTGQQRMDSTQLTSNIADRSRLELLIRLLQRLHQALTPEDQAQYAAVFAPYLRQGAGQYAYRIKGQEATHAHLQETGQVLQRLLAELGAAYAEVPAWAVARRFFDENFKCIPTASTPPGAGLTALVAPTANEQVALAAPAAPAAPAPAAPAAPVAPAPAAPAAAMAVQLKPNSELTSGDLQSLDDLEATYRNKGGTGYKGYVANISETCAPSNPIQLIDLVQVAPNQVSDIQLLKQAVPALTKRLHTTDLTTDGAYVGPQSAQALQGTNIHHTSTNLTGAAPDHTAGHLPFSVFTFQVDASDNLCQCVCPHGQAAQVRLTPSAAAYRLDFDPARCLACPAYQQQQCPVKFDKHQTRAHIPLPKDRLASARRRQHFEATKAAARKLRPAVEATMFHLQIGFPKGRLSVRGLVRVTCVVACGALAVNLRRIHRFFQRPAASAGPRRTAQATAEPAALSFFRWLKALIFRPLPRRSALCGC